jgi:hypothetical protein
MAPLCIVHVYVLACAVQCIKLDGEREGVRIEAGRQEDEDGGVS